MVIWGYQLLNYLLSDCRSDANTILVIITDNYGNLPKIKLSKTNPHRNSNPKSDHDITSVVLLGSATYTASSGNDSPKATLMSFELYATLWLQSPMKIYCID